MEQAVKKSDGILHGGGCVLVVIVWRRLLLLGWVSNSLETFNDEEEEDVDEEEGGGRGRPGGQNEVTKKLWHKAPTRATRSSLLRPTGTSSSLHNNSNSITRVDVVCVDIGRGQYKV